MTKDRGDEAEVQLVNLVHAFGGALTAETKRGKFKITVEAPQGFVWAGGGRDRMSSKSWIVLLDRVRRGVIAVG